MQLRVVTEQAVRDLVSPADAVAAVREIGRASCRERVLRLV